MDARKIKRLTATAHHEAGHAIAAWCLEMKFRRVTIRPDEAAGTLGNLLHHRLPRWFQPEVDSSDRVRIRAENRIVVSFAGQLAEGRFFGRKPRFGMHRDNQSAVDMAFHFCGSKETTEAFLHYCFCVSRDVVNGSWKEIEAVAKALVDRETLAYEEVLEVIWPGSAALRQSLNGQPAPARDIPD